MVWLSSYRLSVCPNIHFTIHNWTFYIWINDFRYLYCTWDAGNELDKLFSSQEVISSLVFYTEGACITKCPHINSELTTGNHSATVSEKELWLSHGTLNTLWLRFIISLTPGGCFLPAVTWIWIFSMGLASLALEQATSYWQVQLSNIIFGLYY